MPSRVAEHDLRFDPPASAHANWACSSALGITAWPSDGDVTVTVGLVKSTRYVASLLTVLPALSTAVTTTVCGPSTSTGSESPSATALPSTFAVHDFTPDPAASEHEKSAVGG